ncbi:MAG: hypothetical protein JNK53_07825, partial [Phycisphaerae bacterium]|nr:hypothetical protein [Phycisphaerae bacterium]
MLTALCAIATLALFQAPAAQPAAPERAPNAPSATPALAPDRITVTLPASAAGLLDGGPRGGRMIVF